MKCYNVPADNISGLIKLIKEQEIEFVIVGPEVPLSLGIVDALNKINILVYGPNQNAARLESNKSFAKSFLQKYNIPTAAGTSFASTSKALEYIQKLHSPLVIKASGLAAGKGVIIAYSTEEAEKTIRSMLENKEFGESSEQIVIEECLFGPETSIHLVISGEDYVILPSSQDHKRLGEDDTGPNTGGMGAFAPTDIITPEHMQIIERTIIKPTLRGLQEENIHFSGTLYIGLMMTKSGPKVLEFNVRFGDPETQVLFPLFQSDPIELLHACALGKLHSTNPKFKKTYAVAIVQAAQGYPNRYNKGEKIFIPDILPQNTSVLHAGTKIDQTGNLVTAGGRVLTVTATAETLPEAIKRAYFLCEKVYFKDNYYRKDIALKAPTECIQIASHLA